MIKYMILLFNMLGLLIYQAFLPTGVNVTQSFPSSVKAGSSFNVEITVNKGDLGGFAKLQEDLPTGFTATAVESQSASFSFVDNAVKYIWTALPSKKEFKITYKVTVGNNVSGDRRISGKFLYVLNNNRQEADIAPAVIHVTNTQAQQQPVATTTGGGNNATQTSQTTQSSGATGTTGTQSTGGATQTQQTPPSSSSTGMNSDGISCTRTVSAVSNGKFTVELTLNKDDLTSFAKIEETLPNGFTATGVNTQGSSFTYLNNKVKFVWVSLPQSNQFKVSYEVTVPASASGDQSISGVFAYVKGDSTKQYNIAASTVSLAPSSQVATNQQPTAQQQSQTQQQTTTQPTTSTQQTQQQSQQAVASQQPATTTSNAIPSPQTNISYKVQIMALHHPVRNSVLAKKFNITETIYREMLQGWTKYTVGNFSVYKQARDHREVVRGKGVVGPFVTAYNTGQRITVQEALMITHQQWYR